VCDLRKIYFEEQGLFFLAYGGTSPCWHFPVPARRESACGSDQDYGEFVTDFTKPDKNLNFDGSIPGGTA
jgi:hypothetical protein